MVMGSFPLTRGKHLLEREGVIGAGLIPAHAGKTTRRSPPSWTHRAHPRSRGENPLSSRSTRQNAGSSPLTRGKLTVFIVLSFVEGLIPAHAGKTLREALGPPGPGAHPRSRGENSTAARKAPIKTGSSPLTRGKRRRRMPRSAGGRLIPAHAGKTGSSHLRV